MIVRLDLKDGGDAIANVHRPGVLARPLDHPRALDGKPTQVQPRTLVAAMLGPHDRENPQFGHRRLAPENLQQTLKFLGAEPVRVDGGLIDGHDYT